MAQRYHNPFASSDISVPTKYHEHFSRYCQRTKESSVDHSPFPRMVDLWFLSFCYAASSGFSPVEVPKTETTKIIDGSIFGSDPWRIHMIMLVAVGVHGSVGIVSEPGKVMALASGLANAGIPRVLEMLSVGGAEPIWNISDALDDYLLNMT